MPHIKINAKKNWLITQSSGEHCLVPWEVISCIQQDVVCYPTLELVPKLDPTFLSASSHRIWPDRGWISSLQRTLRFMVCWIIEIIGWCCRSINLIRCISCLKYGSWIICNRICRIIVGLITTICMTPILLGRISGDWYVQNLTWFACEQFSSPANLPSLVHQSIPVLIEDEFKEIIK